MTKAQKPVLRASIVGVHLEIPLPQFRRHRFHLLQVTLAGQSLVRDRQSPVKLLGLLAHQAALQSALEVANAQLLAAHTAQKDLHVPRVEGRIDARLKLRESLLILHLDRCLLELHFLSSSALPPVSTLERETGLEPATNSLEGCDSTTELLPQKQPLAFSC